MQSCLLEWLVGWKDNNWIFVQILIICAWVRLFMFLRVMDDQNKVIKYSTISNTLTELPPPVLPLSGYYCWELANSEEQNNIYFNFHIQILNRKYKEPGKIWGLTRSSLGWKYFREKIRKLISNFVSLETLNFLITLPGKVNKDIIKTLEKRGL